MSDVTFEAQPGRVTALLGPNGSGKTTTLRMDLAEIDYAADRRVGGFSSHVLAWAIGLSAVGVWRTLSSDIQ